MARVTRPRPFQGWFVIRGLALTTINQSVKFEVSNFTHYEVTKGDTKYRKWGSLGSLRVTGNTAAFDSGHEFLLAFHSNYDPILHRLWDTARYWSKIADCNLPHHYFAPPFRVIPLQFRRDLWLQKTRVHGLSFGVVCVILRLVVLVQYRRVTYGQTDGRTHDDSIYRASLNLRIWICICNRVFFHND